MRVGRDVAVGWKIPGFMKAQLVEVGIPVAPRLVEQVVMQSEADPVLLTSRGPLYCRMGGAWFASSGVGMWLNVLRRYGSRLTAAELLSEPDGVEEYRRRGGRAGFRGAQPVGRGAEEGRPGGLQRLRGFLWPGLLGRWLPWSRPAGSGPGSDLTTPHRREPGPGRGTGLEGSPQRVPPQSPRPCRGISGRGRLEARSGRGPESLRSLGDLG